MITLSFLGDISLNDSYVELYKNMINPFKVLQPLLNNKDYVIGNLECIAKGEKGENQRKKPRLTTTIETLNYLNYINLKVATLAHNHIYDQLEDGFLKTTAFLKKNNIQFMGAGTSVENAQKPLILSKNDIAIGLLNYVTSDTNPKLPDDALVYLNYFDIEKVNNDIADLKKSSDHIVVILHWGGRVEGNLYPDFEQPEIAKKLIDFGADLIIGHHSHTFQPFEVYKGKHIFYSLGNFCFSDYQFEGEITPLPSRRRITGIVNLAFDKKYYKVSLDFFRNDNSSFSSLRSYLNRLKNRNWILKYLLRYKPLWNIYFINNKFIFPFLFFIKRKDLRFFDKFKRLIKSIKKRIQ